MSASVSPQALHLRWRVQACARVLLFALPWTALAMCAALRAPSQLLAWVAVAASVLVTAAALIRDWRQHDVRWLASMLNTHASLEDSAELLLGVEPPASSVARLQQQRLLSRWPALDTATIQPRQRIAPLL